MVRSGIGIRWVLGALCAGAFFLGCTPEPKNVSCSNDGECRKHDERLNYCLESRCVECVGSASCGPGSSCDNGACVQCINNEGCPSGSACVEGTCSAS
jgi:hypothetical protein